MTKKYGLIAEFVAQGPILMECEDMSYEAVHKQFTRMEGSPRVIRLCIVSLNYVCGNASLCPPVPADEDKGMPF